MWAQRRESRVLWLELGFTGFGLKSLLIFLGLKFEDLSNKKLSGWLLAAIFSSDHYSSFYI